MVDGNTRTLALVTQPKSKFRLGKIIKPTTFVWNDQTKFIKDGREMNPADLTTNSPAQLEYFYPRGKGRPVLLKVVFGSSGISDSSKNHKKD